MRNLEVIKNMRNVIATWEVEINSFHDSGFNAGIRKVVAYLDTIVNLEALAATTPQPEQPTSEPQQDAEQEEGQPKHFCKDCAWVEHFSKEFAPACMNPQSGKRFVLDVMPTDCTCFAERVEDGR